MEITKTVSVSFDDFLELMEEETPFAKMNFIAQALKAIEFSQEDWIILKKHKQKDWIIKFLEKKLADLKSV